MSTNIHAQIAVLKNLADGKPPKAHLKTVSEVRGYKLTLAALVRKGWAAVDGDVAGRVHLTQKGAQALRSRP